MKMVEVKIDSCNECPHSRREWVTWNPYETRCWAKDGRLIRKINATSVNMIFARIEIPDFCPLEEG
jgi:hypothetical protein